MWLVLRWPAARTNSRPFSDNMYRADWRPRGVCAGVRACGSTGAAWQTRSPVEERPLPLTPAPTTTAKAHEQQNKQHKQQQHQRRARR